MILHKGTSSIRNRVVENISCGRECTSLLLIELQWCEIALHCSTILENCSRIRKDNMRKVHLRVGGAGSLHDLLISQDREDYTHMMQRSSTKFNSHDREKTGVGRKDSSEIPCKCRQHDMLLQVCSFQMKSTEWKCLELNYETVNVLYMSVICTGYPVYLLTVTYFTAIGASCQASKRLVILRRLKVPFLNTHPPVHQFKN